MPGIFSGETFTFENVPQVRAAIVAQDLDALTIAVNLPPYRSRNFVIKTRPTAKRFKLILRPVQWRLASFAYIYALRFIIQQLARKWPLGSFIYNYPFFVGC